MSDARDFDDELDDELTADEESTDDLDEEERLNRTRADYTGVELDDEFQPVDEMELEELGMELDDPDRLDE
jgi:hypothetical protein